MTNLPPMCYSCTRVHSGEGWRCDAFPGGIPAKIIDWRADHRIPFVGDHGILFEQDPGVEAFPFDLFEKMRS